MATKRKSPTKAVVPAAPVDTLIRMIRNQKVMLDADIAALYGVATKRLNEAVRRNASRFPENFMFQLTQAEADNLRSQIATSSLEHGGRRYRPNAFTEHGVVMLSAVLNSARAIRMSIHVVGAFVRLREMVTASRQLASRVEKLERGQVQTASIIGLIAEDLEQLGHEVKQMKALPEPKRRRIGFKT